jgi:threonine aldolase
VIIDLRSDTVTRPTPAMLEYMLKAAVGDDVFEDDPTVRQLEEKVASIFGKEAGLFCPSGTMSNQIAIKVHTRPMEEVICDKDSHVFNYEAGGMAFLSGVSAKLIQGNRGRFTASDIERNINPDNVHFPRTSLVCVENTTNRGGGAYYDINTLRAMQIVCKKNGLKFHLDGARIFNALVETGEQPIDYGILFDSISICLSKGLGAPMGSVLVGDRDFIKEARRVRKALGGGMRQAGYMAAAGIYALDNHIARLKEDHLKAKKIESALLQNKHVDSVLPVMTNIIIFRLKENMNHQPFYEKCNTNRILFHHTSHNVIRFVTHLDITDKMVERLTDILTSTTN